MSECHNSLNDNEIPIKTIQRAIRKWHKRKNRLTPVSYQKNQISFDDLRVFKGIQRSKNDSNNKMRENIIGCIINNGFPPDYYKVSIILRILKKEIDKYIKILCDKRGIPDIKKVVCIHKAGRKNHFDFMIVINDCEEFMVEFKFNAICVQDTPQFVSPMKPSQYLDSSYEEYYYDNYITKLSSNFNIEIPKREEYLKTIHAPNPECMKLYQEKYYKGCKNSSKYSGEEDDINSYKTALKLSKESIKNFITTNNLKHDKMTQYLLDTQKNKCYMLYKKGKLYYQTKNLDDYIITEVVKDEKRSRYKAKTKSGRTLKILLRWKNGNGIAFPSFQIS